MRESQVKKVENIAFNVDQLKEEYPSVKDIQIEGAFEEGKFNIFKRYCQDNNKVRLDDLSNEDIVNLPKLRGIGAVRFGQIIDRLKEIQDKRSKVEPEEVKNINEIIDIALDKLDDRESLTIIARIIEDLSLQETGEILETSQEEAREIEITALKKIKNAFDQYNAVESLKRMFASAKEFKVKDLEKRINEESEFIINLIRKDKFKGLTKDQDSGRLVFS